MLTELSYFSLTWKAVQEPTFLLLYTTQKQFLLLRWWHKIYFWSLLVDMQMYPLYHKQKLIKSRWNAIVLSPRNKENNISHHSSAFPFANIVKSPTPSLFPGGFHRNFSYFILFPSDKSSRCLFVTKTLFKNLNCRMLPCEFMYNHGNFCFLICHAGLTL